MSSHSHKTDTLDLIHRAIDVLVDDNPDAATRRGLARLLIVGGAMLDRENRLAAFLKERAA